MANKCDYNTLSKEAITLSKQLNNISGCLDAIDYAIKGLSSMVWEGETKSFFRDKYNTLNKNFDIVDDHFNNIRLYIDNVINNYKETEKMMTAAFNSFGGR